MSILIKNALLDNKEQDIYIEEETISEIAPRIRSEAEFKLDGRDHAVIPSFINAHTHAAMTLLRGYADDMLLHEWLEKKIWPVEAKLAGKDVYWGTRLACLEMMKSGTTYFNDMYWHEEQAMKAVQDSGMKAAASQVMIDFFDESKAKEQQVMNKRLFETSKDYKNIDFALGPHAIYTVSPDSLQWAKDFSDEHDVKIHIHLSETKKEVDDCLEKHKMRPAEYLESLGFLGENVIAAHSVWLSNKELDILAKRDVKLVHNPISNMKLSVGNALPFQEIRKRKMTLALGTDGCSSNNSLSMFGEMKTASLLQKHHHGRPDLMTADEIFEIATKGGATAFGLDSGEIKEGRKADLLLINLKIPEMTPNHNLISNLVYSANASCITTTIGSGRILMHQRKVEGEDEVMAKAAECARAVCQ